MAVHPVNSDYLWDDTAKAAFRAIATCVKAAGHSAIGTNFPTACVRCHRAFSIPHVHRSRPTIGLMCVDCVEFLCERTDDDPQERMSVAQRYYAEQMMFHNWSDEDYER